MKRSQLLKILVLIGFVSIIAGSAYYMYTSWVKKSPYHQTKNAPTD